MVEFELTSKHAGIRLWGDTWTLQRIHEVLHKINEQSVVIENKEGFFLGLAYDVRKAYEGQRKKKTKTSFEDKCKIYGVEILWPVLIAQVGLLREAMAFVPTNRNDQIVAYELEYIVECAANKALPGRGEEIMSLMRRIGSSQHHIQKVLDSRCRYFIELPPAKRLRMLPSVLESFDPMFDFWSKRSLSVVGTDKLSPADFNKYQDESRNWPDFEW